MSAPCLISVIALIAVVFIGQKFKINMGILGLAAAYICGSLIGGLPAGSILGLWPVSVMTQVATIMLFFSVALNNGTFKSFAEKLIYTGRNLAPVIPFLLYLSIFIVAALGAGSTAVYIMALPIYMVAKQIKMKMGLFPIIVIAGLNGGAWQVFARDGAMAAGIMANAGFSQEEVSFLAGKLGIHYLISSLLLFAAGYLIFQGWKCQPLVTDAPPPYTREQRTTLILVGLFAVIYMVPTILNNFISHPVLALLASRVDLFMLSCVFAVICLVLKLSSAKVMIDTVPWMALITVGGMGTFVKVCTQLGIVDVLSSFISNNVSPALVPNLLAICAGCMSLFSATMGVVLPAFYPLALSLGGTMGISMPLMVSAISIGSGMSGISPFSAMGAATYSVVEEEDNQTVFNSQIFTVVLGYAVTQVCIIAGLYAI
ncbi:MAG: hypothetical protein HFF39_03640 [Lawsonibacter sp.]|nr:hypothetical protein [Lawsonibacter sp.]